MILLYVKMFYVLVALHFFADFVFQNDFLAAAKNRNTPLGATYWTVCLPAHAAIHGFMIWITTMSLTLAIAETVMHGLIDFDKCENKISFHTDQFLHILCKAAWVGLFIKFDL